MNVIEQRLLDKELKVMQAELARGMKIVNNVLISLPVATDKDSCVMQEAWIKSLFEYHVVYPTAHAIKTPAVTKFPESMKEKLLKRLVDVFLEEVEQMQEITSNLEQS